MTYFWCRLTVIQVTIFCLAFHWIIPFEPFTVLYVSVLKVECVWRVVFTYVARVASSFTCTLDVSPITVIVSAVFFVNRRQPFAVLSMSNVECECEIDIIHTWERRLIGRRYTGPLRDGRRIWGLSSGHCRWFLAWFESRLTTRYSWCIESTSINTSMTYFWCRLVVIQVTIFCLAFPCRDLSPILMSCSTDPGLDWWNDHVSFA